MKVLHLTYRIKKGELLSDYLIKLIENEKALSVKVEIATTKINGKLYTLGVPYEPARITSSVYAMSTDPIAYSLYAIDRALGRADNTIAKHNVRFTQRYLTPAKALVGKLLANPAYATDGIVCATAHITPQQLSKARLVHKEITAPKDMMAMMMGGMSKGKS